MGYSVRITMDSGGSELAEIEDVCDPTYNLAGMFHLALGASLSSFNGKGCAEIADTFRKAHAHIIDPANRAEYEKLAPSNGWGDYDGAVWCIEKMMLAVIRHPLAIFEVH